MSGVAMSDAQRRARELRWALAGSVCAHYKRGDTYTIETFCVREADGAVMIVYVSAGFTNYWVRPYSEFVEEVQPGVPRFRVL